MADGTERSSASGWERGGWCSWSGKRMASPSGYREKCPGCGQMVAPVAGFMGPEFENHRTEHSDEGQA